jgi:hypothetical protein
VSVSWELVGQIVILILSVGITATGFLLKLSINRVLQQGDEAEKKLAGITIHLTEMNATVREIKVWQMMHEGQDNERHRENLNKFDSIVRELEKIG